MSCIACDARLQCKLDFWNGAKRKENPYWDPSTGLQSIAAEAWNAEWDTLQGNSLVMADFQIMREQQEALKQVLKYPPLFKGTMIKQLLAILSK